MADELEASIETARAAGEVLRAGFGRGGKVRYKGEVDLVTETDEESERLIKEALLGAFPTYGMLAEESGQTAGEDEARWIVDPLDGTINFAHDLPIFAVSIALQRGDDLVLGVVYDPMRDELFTARRGEGAFLNGKPITPTKTGELIHALLATGFPYDRSELPEALELFGRFASRTRSIRRLGSAAIDLCYVACGRLDGYYERGVWPWDVAAGALILEEAGGRVTDYRGDPPDMEDREILASNGPLHQGMLEVISNTSG
ncbi:inositol monophosphatase family protein [Rubrobacter naiadicus]|uniref:inositol monophosphatase family protein n=1 Tax=Rubrobacter naiadicus TaxID=1392641 RepID=UPI002362A786|nr:inositol monophosphatase family protein [Rubrobacter naiadicus]